MAEERCPRCSRPLRARTPANLLCDGCGGAFIGREAMGPLLGALRRGGAVGLDASVASAPYRTSAAPRGAPAESTVRYLACPRCGELMNRTQVVEGAGIVVDMCLVDGVWFDGEELAHVKRVLFSAHHGAAAGEEAEVQLLLGDFFGEDG